MSLFAPQQASSGPFASVQKKYKKYNVIDSKRKAFIQRTLHEMRQQTDHNHHDRIMLLHRLDLMLDLLERQRVFFADLHVRQLMAALKAAAEGAIDDVYMPFLWQKVQELETDSLTLVEKIIRGKFMDFTDNMEILVLRDELLLQPSHIEHLAKLSPHAFEKFYNATKNDLFHPRKQVGPYAAFGVPNVLHVQCEYNMEIIMMAALKNHNFTLFNKLSYMYLPSLFRVNIVKDLCTSNFYFNDVEIFRFLRQNYPVIPFHITDIETALDKSEKIIDFTAVNYFRALLQDLAMACVLSV